MGFRNWSHVICIFTITVFNIEIKGLIFVNDCPTEPTGVVEASQRLKCDEDRYGHNQYMCVPNKEKTSLVEFCYDGIMGIQKEGYCLQVSGNGNVTQQSCVNFLSGCPERTFWKFEFYKYHECLNINALHHCYVKDPSCPLQELTTNTYMHSTDCDKTKLVIVVTVLSAVLVTITVLFVIVLCRKLKWTKKTTESRDQMRDNKVPLFKCVGEKKHKNKQGKKKAKNTISYV